MDKRGEVLVNDSDGELADMLHLRLYAREDVFTTKVRHQLHEPGHNLF